MAFAAIKPTRLELNSRNYYDYASSPYYHRLVVPALLHWARQQSQPTEEFQPTLLSNMAELIISQPGENPGQHKMVMVYVEPLTHRKRALELHLDFSQLNLDEHQLTNRVLDAQAEAVTRSFGSAAEY